MWFTFGVNSAWKAFLVKDELWDTHSVDRTAPLVLNNITETDPLSNHKNWKVFFNTIIFEIIKYVRITLIEQAFF